VTAAALSAPREAVTRFQPDVVGQYRLTLTVRDNSETTRMPSWSMRRPPDLLPEPCDCAGEPGEVFPCRYAWSAPRAPRCHCRYRSR
jgi:hypothetical protein